MTNFSDDDFAFVAGATKNIEWITGLDIRRFGERLEKEEVKSYGARANSILTKQYIAILNGVGLNDPMEAANILANAINVGIGSSSYLTDREGEPLRFFPSNMAAGPCRKAEEIGCANIPRHIAPILPIDGCDRIGQCACRYLPAVRESVPINLTPEEQEVADEILSRIGITIRFGESSNISPARSSEIQYKKNEGDGE